MSDGTMSDGLPGVGLVRGTMLLGAFALVVGLFLLFSTPTLPHEDRRTAGAPRPTPAGAAPTASAGTQAARRHTIQPGDTLLVIAEQYDTTVDAIRAANP